MSKELPLQTVEEVFEYPEYSNIIEDLIELFISKTWLMIELLRTEHIEENEDYHHIQP